MSTLIETLARHLSEIQLDRLSGTVRRRARQAVLDTLGAMLVGSRSDVVERLERSLSRMGDVGSMRYVGSEQGHSAAGAALMGGTAAHAWEVDDFGGCGHSGAVVVPAVLVASQAKPIGGQEFLAAVIAGYEAAARVTDAAGGYRAQTDQGWHTTGTCGSFGAAAGVARVLGLGAEQTADALGITGSFTGGIWAFIADGAMTKRIHAGKAAANGLSAAFLAEGGVTGPRQVLEASWGGFFATYMNRAGDRGAITAGGPATGILASGIKPYATCRGNHFPIEALLTLMRQHDLEDSDIAAVMVHLPEQAARQLGGREIRDTLDAQMSMPFGVAVALVRGDASLEHFLPERLTDSDVRAAMDRVALVVDTGMVSADRPRVEVQDSDGNHHSLHIKEALGGPGKPLTDEQVQAKFERLASYTLPGERAQEIINLVDNLESSQNVCEDILALASNL